MHVYEKTGIPTCMSLWRALELWLVRAVVRGVSWVWFTGSTSAPACRTGTEEELDTAVSGRHVDIWSVNDKDVNCVCMCVCNPERL